ACIVHVVRLLLWRGWRVRGHPLVSAMHVGYAWLVGAFGLAAYSALTGGTWPRAWLHAFTVGAVGTMMLALMPRVALRHTGRAPANAPFVAASCAAMTLAAALRLVFGLPAASAWYGAVAAALWAACFVGYAIVYAPMLMQPSLPRPAAPAPIA
ncbi:MAG TPA: NnrS family protein, partial [Gammaproteobacteria bacterium]|nr:NnrS family protein [Gammaproteobacteria bacterium]